MVPWPRDEKGSSLIQFALILPILILIAFGFFEIWRAMSVKLTVDRAAYEAVRHLSVNHTNWTTEQARAKRLAIDLINSNPFLNPETERTLRIYIVPEAPPSCESPFFTVRIELDLRWPQVFLYLASPNLRLVGEHVGYVECEPSFVPGT